MKFGTLLAHVAGGLALVSQAAAARDKCGSSDPEPEALEAAARLRDAQRAEGALRRRDDGEGLLITTYVHVVEDTANAGFVTDGMITDQVRQKVLGNFPHTKYTHGSKTQTTDARTRAHR